MKGRTIITNLFNITYMFIFVISCYITNHPKTYQLKTTIVYLLMILQFGPGSAEGLFSRSCQ